MINTYHYSLNKILLFRLLSKKFKVHTLKTIILPVVLYGFETWTLTLREEQKLRMLENKVLGNIFGTKRDKITDNGEIYIMLSYMQSIIRLTLVKMKN